MARKSMTFRLDEGLVGRVDVAAAAAGVSRTGFLEGALEAVLGGSPGMDRVPVSAPRPALRVVGSRGAVSSSDAKRNVSPRWRGGVEGSV